MSTLRIPCSIILLVAIEEKHNWNQEMQLIATYLYINKEHMCRIVDMYIHLYAYIYIYVQAQQHSQLNINHDHIYIYIHIYWHLIETYRCIQYMVQTTGMDRYVVIRANLHEGVTQMKKGVWITEIACVGPYILSCSHIIYIVYIYIVYIYSVYIHIYIECIYIECIYIYIVYIYIYI